jgi:hypothetical protein
VIVRRCLPYVLALALGAGTALLAACGGGTSAGVPAANAGDLKSQIKDVLQAVDDGRCSDVPGQLKQVDEGIDDLPPTIDSQLVGALRDGADKLRALAVDECSATTTQTTQTTETQTTETTTTETTTEPTPTTTESTPTTTTPTTPTPEPTPTPTPTPTPVPPPPPAGTPGGGVVPEVPPG